MANNSFLAGYQHIGGASLINASANQYADGPRTSSLGSQQFRDVLQFSPRCMDLSFVFASPRGINIFYPLFHLQVSYMCSHRKQEI